MTILNYTEKISPPSKLHSFCKLKKPYTFPKLQNTNVKTK